MQNVPQSHSTATIVTMINPAVALLIIAFLKAGTLYADERLSSIELPPGFSIEIYAEGVENARQMVRGDLGTMLVSDDFANVIYRISYTR